MQSSSKFPFVQAAFVGRPKFLLHGGGTHEAGTAFVARSNSGKIRLLTVLHCFGPAGGYRRQIPSRDLPRHVKSTQLLDFSTNKVLLETGGVVLGKNLIEPTSDESSNDCSGDIISFEISSDNTSASDAALPVAAAAPAVGANVWLAGREVRDRTSPPGARLFAGTVARYEPGAMIVHLREKRVDLWCFSGSPILSEDATQVVGLLGGGDKEKGVIYCNAMPPELINDWLQST